MNSHRVGRITNTGNLMKKLIMMGLVLTTCLLSACAGLKVYAPDEVNAPLTMRDGTTQVLVRQGLTIGGGIFWGAISEDPSVALISWASSDDEGFAELITYVTAQSVGETHVYVIPRTMIAKMSKLSLT